MTVHATAWPAESRDTKRGIHFSGVCELFCYKRDSRLGFAICGLCKLQISLLLDFTGAFTTFARRKSWDYGVLNPGGYWVYEAQTTRKECGCTYFPL